MLVIKYIEKEVRYCRECPYYYEDRYMGATYPCCELNGYGYSAILGDITAHSNCISKECKYEEKML